MLRDFNNPSALHALAILLGLAIVHELISEALISEGERCQTYDVPWLDRHTITDWHQLPRPP